MLLLNSSIIRAYPSERSSLAREDFLNKLDKKFTETINTATEVKAIHLIEPIGASPSVFQKDHFRYGDDNINYFNLYQELMFPYDKMVEIIEPLKKKYKINNCITFEDIAEESFVSKTFFDAFPEKLIIFLKLFAEKLFV